MRIALGLFCLALAGQGCASVRQTADPMRSAGSLRKDEISLCVQALPQSRETPHWISTKETLRTNDRFSVHVKTGQPLFLYVFSVPKKGEASLLYAPAEGSQPQPELRLPVEGGYFTLGNQTGRERIRLIAARSPLSAEQLGSYTADDAEKERDPEKDPEKGPEKDKGKREKEEPPPPVIPEGERDPRIVRAALNRDGIGTAHFDFTHR